MDTGNKPRHLAELVPIENRNVKRKLAAILSTDVQGYSRLMADNEVATIKSIKACRRIIFRLVTEHQGRVVDSPGDNILSEFSSVTDAVECAVQIQKQVTVYNQDLPDDRKMRFRIGIDLGDIIEDSRRIYGDGINIAARLEGIAPGGGICISGSAYDQVKKKLALGYEFLGNKDLKNIADPVPAYRILTDPKNAGKLKYRSFKDHPNHNVRKRILRVLILILVIGGAILIKKNADFTSGEPRKMFSKKIMGLKIPDKPSIAVLPFINMSGDKEQEYFSDGLTEDLITDLSRLSGLFVISRNSVFAYKGKSTKVDKIGRELGVKYVLEGSVRKAGKQVRINAQLIDTITGGHIWAERYDRDMNDIFSLQDEVRGKIVVALAVQITSDDKKRMTARTTKDPKAYDYYLKAKELCEKKDIDSIVKGRQILEKVIYMDPNFAKAYSILAKSYFTQWIFGEHKEPAILDKVFEYGRKTVAINPYEPSGYGVMAYFYLWTKQHDAAIEKIQKAISLDPNNSEWLASYGELLAYTNEPEKAVDYLRKAMRLDPKYPAWYPSGLGHAYFLIKEYDKAITAFKKAVKKDHEFWPAHLLMALSYNAKGMKNEAHKAIEAALEENENLAGENWEDILPYKYSDSKLMIQAMINDLGIKE